MGDHSPRFPAFRPSADEAADLLRRAEKHPLGIEFLKNGDQGAVAATFQVHGFLVDAARQHLASAAKPTASRR